MSIKIIIGHFVQKILANKKHPGHLVTIPLVYMWGDAHFYWSHRLLHTPWLYKRFGEETTISIVSAF